MPSVFRCRDCKATPSDVVFLKDARQRNGLRTLCAPCSRQRRKDRKAVFLGGRVDGEKQCGRCGVSKPRLDFSEHPLGTDGRNSWCRSCTNAQASDRVKARRLADPAYREALAEAKRAARRAADPGLVERDARRAAQEALKADHRAHVDARQRHLADCRAHVEAYEQHRQAQAAARKPVVDPQQTVYERAKSAWRRARRLGRLAPWATLPSTLPFYERAVALEKVTGVEWNVDHYVPLRAERASGLHCSANLQVIPRAVNEGKGNLFLG